MDLMVLQQSCDELAVVKILFELDTSLGIKFEDIFLVMIQFSLPLYLEFIVFIYEVILLLVFLLVLRTPL